MDPLELVAGWPVETAAVGFLSIGNEPETQRTIGPEDRSFPWASVTKLATALAVLIAAEEGSLSLDDPAGPPGSTVRHLLAHASGLGPNPGPPLDPPARSRIYSNAGYLLLGEVIADRTGIGFADYLRDGVLEPLGMAGTVLDSEADVSAGPTGVETDVETEEGVIGAAAGLSGPLRDLLSLGRELAVPTLISHETHRAMVSVQFAGLAGVLPGFQRFDPCDWGLGVEIRDGKRPHWTGTTNSASTFGHFGRSGSFLWVDPVAGMICAGLSDRPFGLWAVRAWPILSDAVLSARA
jgi:CubicO group peptidase (beta-lactamase class C family)